MHRPVRCSACSGPFHPATGHHLSVITVLCGPCARDHLAWLKHHTQRRWGGLKFYDYAATSVKPPKDE